MAKKMGKGTREKGLTASEVLAHAPRRKHAPSPLDKPDSLGVDDFAKKSVPAPPDSPAGVARGMDRREKRK